MSCCLTAPSHYLNQCWHVTALVMCHSAEGNFIGNICISYQWRSTSFQWFSKNIIRIYICFRPKLRNFPGHFFIFLLLLVVVVEGTLEWRTFKDDKDPWEPCCMYILQEQHFIDPITPCFVRPPVRLAVGVVHKMKGSSLFQAFFAVPRP